jgi:hypothetical protein
MEGREKDGEGAGQGQGPTANRTLTAGLNVAFFERPGLSGAFLPALWAALIYCKEESLQSPKKGNSAGHFLFFTLSAGWSSRPVQTESWWS